MAEPYKIEIIISGEGAPEVREIERGLRGMKSAAGGVETSFAAVNVQLNQMFTQVTAVGRRLTLMGAVGTAAMGGLLFIGMRYNVQVEQMRQSLLIFLKTQERVNKAYEWAADLTLKVPLTRRDVIPMITMLEQYGLAYQDWAESVIDAAAATKRPGESIQSQMDTITRAFGQIKFGDIGIGLMSLRTAGLAVDTILAGLTKAERADPTKVLETLKNYIDTEFLGAAEKFGNTWQGLMMTFKSLTERFIGAAVAPIFEKLRGILKSVIDFLSSPVGRAAIKEFGELIADVFMKAINVAIKAFGIIRPILIKMFASERIKRVLAYVVALGPPLLIVVGLFLQIVGTVGSLVVGMVMLGTAGWTALGIVALVLVYIIQVVTVVIAIIITMRKKFADTVSKVVGHLKHIMDFVGFVIFVIVKHFLWFSGIVSLVFGKVASFVVDVLGESFKIFIIILELAISVLEEYMRWIDEVFKLVGKEAPFEGMRKSYEGFKKSLGEGIKFGGVKLPAGGLTGFPSALDVPEIPTAPAPAGGGGRGGRGGGLGGVTVYQTLEYGAVLVYPANLDRDSLLSMLESIGLEEAPTRG